MKWFIALFLVIALVSAQSYDIDVGVQTTGQNMDVEASGNVDGQAVNQQGKYNYGLNADGDISGTIMINGQGYNISQVKIGQKVNLSNGNKAEIRILPSTASATALARLQINCNNCTIELKEVGSKNNVSIAYEIQGNKDSRFLGLFKAKMNVKVQVNAETGEVIGVNKPWWAFLASESKIEAN